MYPREHWAVENHYEHTGWIEIKDSVNKKKMEELYKLFKKDGYITRLVKRIDLINTYEEIIMD